ncbi:helix-turn-helix domain-containing protein [Desulforhopalus singaporensis]|uniref:Helix-turn-helix domain-containing protein n=1 Tax=Desulforhopalus singaporensis TaxID=91360 RepID=A0A1H0NCY7_9BACT|nr:helix-turn-helix domain-containing protein [Desulforhopalus singaporensis]SDO90503.1 Helix-turn-helix domain-containing protein [Desulforhopalus singaporensis]
MMSEEHEQQHTPLGEYLRSKRHQQGLDLDTVATRTKISLKNLSAIESGSYEKLPAEVFARGFYRLYAELLGLDPDEVLASYDLEKTHHPKDGLHESRVRIFHSEDVGNMAERPSFFFFSSIGLLLLVLLLFGAFLCWYFSWNPATFLSQKLRSLQTVPETVEQVHNDRSGSSPLALLKHMPSLEFQSTAVASQQSPGNPYYDFCIETQQQPARFQTNPHSP